MPRTRWSALITTLLITVASLVGVASAQGVNPDEPPLIAGRVALAEGDAQIWRVEEDTSGQWDRAVVNDVVTVGTGLYTGASGRYEVRVGPNSYRLGENSRGGFGQLDYTNSVFNLEYGTVNVRLARPEHGETSAVTVAGVRLELVAPGRYRIDAADRGPMRLTVFEGHATLAAPTTSTGVAAGQALVVNPGGSGLNYEQPITTAFDEWALSRDQRYTQVRSAQYVSPYMTGYEELDAYGDWTTDATYGAVWYPRVVPVGWAPYRYGQWRWVRPWGWTWVDTSPWGYAPFHYGRWVMVGPRWCWVPGGYVRRPVWAPALVGFVGGSGINVAVNVGGPVVGWYPLAPWHRYEPHYRHNPTYVTVINQTVINNPPRGVPRTINQGPGATVVPGPRFREPINRVALPVHPRPEQLQPVAPPPQSVAPAPRAQTPKFSDNDGRRSPEQAVPPGARGGRGAPPPMQQAPVQQAPVPQAPMQAPVPPGPSRAAPAQPAQPDPSAQPPHRGSPPTRVMPPPVAEPMPGRGVTPPPPLPGNDPAPLQQPPVKRPAPTPQPPAVPTVPPPERPAPRPHLPSDQLPPGQQPINPAEPPRFPPGAPPTVPQPKPFAPPARPVQVAPPVQAPAPQPAPVQPAAVPHAPVQPAPARPAPPVAVPQPAPAPVRAAPPVPASPAAGAPAAPPAAHPAHPPQSQREQVLRNQPEPQRGGKPIDADSPGKGK